MLLVQKRTAAKLPQVTYTRGLDLSGTLQGAGGIGGLLARTEHSRLNAQPATAFYHSDGNGNVTALLNPAGGLVAQYAYDPYGQLLLARGPLADLNLIRFSGKEYHNRSGLYYYGYRFYDPNLQRWINRDPIQEAGGMNLYGFVGNNPVTYIDSNGLDVFLLNYGKGGFGHTYLLVNKPGGGILVAEFWSKKYSQEGSAISGLKALVYDTGLIKTNEWPSFEEFATTLDERINVDGIAFGTTLDDQLLIDEILRQAKNPSGYSVLLGKQCHRTAALWFYDYVNGGETKPITCLIPSGDLKTLNKIDKMPDVYWVTSRQAQQWWLGLK